MLVGSMTSLLRESAMNSQLQRFREQHEFCDIFFRVNGVDFDLHRLVLATRMEEFIKVGADLDTKPRASVQILCPIAQVLVV